jgi:hypothetical protein
LREIQNKSLACLDIFLLCRIWVRKVWTVNRAALIVFPILWWLVPQASNRLRGNDISQREPPRFPLLASSRSLSQDLFICPENAFKPIAVYEFARECDRILYDDQAPRSFSRFPKLPARRRATVLSGQSSPKRARRHCSEYHRSLRFLTGAAVVPR